MAVGFGRCDDLGIMFVMPIGDEAFKSADCDGFAFDSAHAFAFALVFLRADAAADSRQA